MEDNAILFPKNWEQNDLNTDDRVTHYINTYQKWRDAIPMTIWTIVERMLEQFEYFGHQRVNDCLAALHCKAASEYSLDPDMALYTYIQENNGTLNSSNDFWFEYRTINKIGYKNCSDNITALSPDIWEYVQDIVIIDDFCGTGGTLKKFLESSSAEFTRQGKVGFTGPWSGVVLDIKLNKTIKYLFEKV